LTVAVALLAGCAAQSPADNTEPTTTTPTETVEPTPTTPPPAHGATLTTPDEQDAAEAADMDGTLP